MATHLMLSYMESEGVNSVAAGGMFLFLSVLMICIFTFISIAVWTEARRREREAYYKAESMRRMAEIPGDGAKGVIEIMREEERIQNQRAIAQVAKKREGMKVGGLVNIGVGIGLYLFMRSIGGPAMVGSIVAGVGVALLAYVYLLAPRQPLA